MSGMVLARYMQGAHVDELFAESRSGATSDYQEDRLDSTTSLSKSIGTLTDTYIYDSFVRLTASTETITNPFHYTSRKT